MSNSKQQVSFKELKARVSIEAALSHYGARVRKSGKELRGKGPLPCGAEGGDKCFSVDPEKRGGVWKCHHKGCGADQRKQGGDLLVLAEREKVRACFRAKPPRAH